MPKQDKEGGIIPPSTLVSSLPLVCCPQGEFVETTSLIAEYGGNDTLQQAGNPLCPFGLCNPIITGLAVEITIKLTWIHLNKL